MDGASEADFGARFLREFRRLGGLASTWRYAVVTGLETADRAGVVALLRETLNLVPYRIVVCAQTGTPEELAGAVLAEINARNSWAG